MRVTAREIAEILGISRIAVIKRAKKEKWLYVEERREDGKGKPIKYYLLESMPEETRREILNVTSKCNQNALKCNLNVTTQLSENKQENENEKNDNVHINVTSENDAYCEDVDNKEENGNGCLVEGGLNNQNGVEKTTKQPEKCLTKQPAKDEIWLSTKDVSELLGISLQAVQKNCRNNKYNTCEIYSAKSRGGKKFLVALSSLPAEAQVKWVFQNKEEAKGLSDSIIDKLSSLAVLEIEKMRNRVSLGSIQLDDEEKEELGKILKMIDEARDIPFGTSKRKHYEKVARKYGKGRSTIERYLKIFNEAGIAGLRKIVSKRREKGVYVWSPEAIDFLKGVFLRGIKDGNKMSKQRAYEAVVSAAKKRGWQIGSKSSAYAILRTINPLLIKYAKGGRLALDNVFYIARRYDDLHPFQVVVGDQHQFDFWVRDIATDEIFRPTGYFFIDARTRLVYGFAFSGKKYNSQTIGLALRMGLLTWGFFKAIYTDNGKPEISKYVDSIAKELSTFGAESKDVSELYATKEGYVIEDDDGNVVEIVETKEEFHKKTKPYNAKAKNIERFFRSFKDLLCSLGVPGRVVERNDNIEDKRQSQKRLDDEIEREKILTYEEFVLKVFEAVKVYNNRRHGSLGCSPIEELTKAIRTEGFELVLPEDIEEIDLALLARAKRKVNRGRIRINGILYEGEEISTGNLDAGLWHLADKTEIEVRYNPFDSGYAYAILPDNSIRKLKPVTLGSMVDDELTRELNERKRRLINAVTEEYRTFVIRCADNS